MFQKDGQTLGLVALIILLLGVIAFFIYNIGDFYIKAVKEQSAVDAAMISGASVQADYLNMIVRNNRNTIRDYYILIWACRICELICIPVFPCCGRICYVTTPLMHIIEKRFMLKQMTLAQMAGIKARSEALSAYRRSGGKGNLEILLSSDPYPSGDDRMLFPNTLRLSMIYSKMPKTRFSQNKKTFCGLGEKKRNSMYDWKGMISWMRVQGNYQGFYDKAGPFIKTIPESTHFKFKPVSSWFSKTQKISVHSAARPYGGHVHDKYSYGLGWPILVGGGEDTFTAKLVPTKSLLYRWW